jgi:acetyltransferase-like isoleucine patch superfamily enzyme
MFRKLYLSEFGYIISFLLNCFSFIHKPFMVYGYYNRKSKSFKKYTRISSSAKIINKTNLNIKDHVWVGHYCLIDCIGGVEICEGVNISSHSVIYSHSSHDALRILGRDYIKVEANKRPGYLLKPVSIGAYTFIGTSSIILPGVSIGKGCIIGAGSIVTTDLPDYSIAYGNPAKIVGDTRERDQKHFPEYIESSTYFKNYLK